MIHKNRLKLFAPAKLNLTLDVLGRRADGYHELDMLMIRVSLFDELTIAKASHIDVRYKNIPTPQNDIVKCAIEAYTAQAGKKLGLKAIIKKHIPMEAGLGGGSADAATVLRGMQRLYNLLAEEELHEAALKVGSDVPYCLHNDPCRAGGVGEQLIFLRIHGKPLWFLLLKPAFGISTGALFNSLQLPVSHPDTAGAQSALITGDLASLGGILQNALQPAASSLYPEVNELYKRLLKTGALGAAMTGAGSCVFGLFESEAAARAALVQFCDVPFRMVCHSIT